MKSREGPHSRCPHASILDPPLDVLTTQRQGFSRGGALPLELLARALRAAGAPGGPLVRVHAVEDRPGDGGLELRQHSSSARWSHHAPLPAGPRRFSRARRPRKPPIRCRSRRHPSPRRDFNPERTAQ